jgi:hypothetical protein
MRTTGLSIRGYDNCSKYNMIRTIEGVWMSITPTADTLLVALDFEGDIRVCLEIQTLISKQGSTVLNGRPKRILF